MTIIHPGHDRASIYIIVENAIEKFRDIAGAVQVNNIKAHLLRRLVDDVIYGQGEHWGWDDEAKRRILVEAEQEHFETLATKMVAELFYEGPWKVVLASRYSDEDDYELVGSFGDAGTALAVGLNRAGRTFEEIVELDGACGNTEHIDSKLHETPEIVYVYQYHPDGESNRFTIHV